MTDVERLLADVLGDLPTPGDDQPRLCDQFEAHVMWHGEPELVEHRTYLLRAPDGSTVPARVSRLKHRLDLETGEHLAATTLSAGLVGVVNLTLEREIPFRPYTEDRRLGRFELLDPDGGHALGIVLIHFALRRATNVRWQSLAITKADHVALNRHRPCVVWFTGLSGAGKSTIANRLEAELYRRGHHTYLLDGDNVRHGLNRDLGFTDADRVENIRRVAEVAKLMVDAGLIVLVSFISPFRSERRMARALFDEGQFLEIFVDTPLSVAEERDPKGLYKKARRGELKNFTGLDSPYEPPEHPEVHLETVTMSVEEATRRVGELLEEKGILPAT
jgi:bifunctional enzyme CysN/CysC